MQASVKLIGAMTGFAIAVFAITLNASQATAADWWCKIPLVSCQSLFDDNPSAGPSVPLIDEKIYASKMCRPTDGRQWGDFTSYLTMFKNNNGNESRAITCPVVRDATELADGIKHFAVEVYNAQAGKRLSCSLFTMNGVGLIVGASTVFTAAQGLQYLTHNGGIKASRLAGEYALECDLPPSSSILNYKVHEIVGYKK